MFLDARKLAKAIEREFVTVMSYLINFGDIYKSSLGLDDPFSSTSNMLESKLYRTYSSRSKKERIEIVYNILQNDWWDTLADFEKFVEGLLHDSNMFKTKITVIELYEHFGIAVHNIGLDVLLLSENIEVDNNGNVYIDNNRIMNICATIGELKFKSIAYEQNYFTPEELDLDS